MPKPGFDKVIWVLSYGGLLVAGLGWALTGDAALHGGLLVVIGLVAVAAGVVLIVVRSRRAGDAAPAEQKDLR